MKIELFPCGTEVVLKRSQYAGVITGITLRGERITYAISYWESGTYKETWFASYEFSVTAHTSTMKIGFKKKDTES